MSRMNGSAERRGRHEPTWTSVALLSICGGCATYTDHLKEAHALYRQSRHVEAEASVDALLNELREDGADPNGSNIPLLQVEKATLLMARGEYAEACSLWATADSSLEVLDLRNTTGESIARFLFSDTAGPYAMHPYEKGMLNTLNMLCFLAEGNLSSSRVEARRYAIVDTFYELEEEGHRAGNPLGDWLAGVVFFLSGNSRLPNAMSGNWNSGPRVCRSKLASKRREGEPYPCGGRPGNSPSRNDPSGFQSEWRLRLPAP